jgi:hypothetical protein
LRVNEQAPIYVRREITVFAPPEKVWDWLSRVDLWQDWHPEIAASYWIGAGDYGEESRRGWQGGDGGGRGEHGGRHARFKWRQGPVRVTSLIESWDVSREIGWVGHAYSAVVRHVFRMDGDFRRTHIVSEHSIEGPPASLMKPLIRGLAVRTTETWLAVLKTRLESLHERNPARQRPPRPPTLPSSRISRLRM